MMNQGQFQLQIMQLTVGKSGTFAQQYRRPYNTHITGDVVTMLQDRVASVGGNPEALNGGLFAGVAGQFLAPQATPESAIMIPNGWHTERFYFFMEVRVYHNGLGGFTTEFIQGYTDQADLSYSGNFDPNTVFFINSITRMKQRIEHTPMGARQVAVVNDAFHVLSNNQYGGIDALRDPSRQNHCSMRPADIQHLAATNYLNLTGAADLSVMNTTQPKASRRTNGLANEYTGVLLSSHATALAGDMHGEGGPGVYSQALRTSLEKPLTTDAFVKAISQMNNAPISDSFTFNDLLRLDPQLGHTSDQRVRMIKPGAAQMARQGIGGMYNSGQSENWQGSDISTHAATVLTNGITGLMIESGLAVVSFLVTNQSFGGQPVWQFAQAIGLGNQDVSGIIPYFQSRVFHDLIEPVTLNNQIGFTIQVSCQLTYATEVTLQLDTQPEVTYVAPTFADAMATPVVTADINRLNEVASNFTALMDQVISTPRPSLESVQAFGTGSI